MDPARIAELLVPFMGEADGRCLTPGAVGHISTYIDLLLRWNARMNLTAIRDPEEIVTRHFGESFFAARHLFPCGRYEQEGHGFSRADKQVQESRAFATAGSADARQPSLACPPQSEGRDVRVADLGSGAGFPGIPMKLWAPDISLTLVEANQKKSTFLRELTRTLTLTDVNIQSARAETLPPASFETVTLRAVERFEAILPVAASLVLLGGRLALLIGSAQQETAQQILPRLSWSTPYPITQSSTRILLIGHLQAEPRE